MSMPLSPPVVVLCMHSALLGGLEQTALLHGAQAQGLADGRLVFLPYDTLLFALPYRNRSYLALGDSGPLREVYDAVLTVSLESGPVDEALEAARASGEVAAHLEPEQVGRYQPPQGAEPQAPAGVGRSSPPLGLPGLGQPPSLASLWPVTCPLFDRSLPSP